MDDMDDMDDMFSFKELDEELIQRCKLVATICELPYFQFLMSVNSDKALQTSIMRNSIEFYENELQRLNALFEPTKHFEQAKLKYSILNKTQDEMQEIRNRMDDRYYN